MRRPVADGPPRVSRLETNRAALRATNAKERSDARSKFPEPLTGVDTFEHGDYQDALETGARWQCSSFLDHAAEPVPQDGPAWIAGWLEGSKIVT
jgi:hypothetical protein